MFCSPSSISSKCASVGPLNRKKLRKAEVSELDAHHSIRGLILFNIFFPGRKQKWLLFFAIKSAILEIGQTSHKLYGVCLTVK